jgi:membrane protein involved in colicin uptake
LLQITLTATSTGLDSALEATAESTPTEVATLASPELAPADGHAVLALLDPEVKNLQLDANSNDELAQQAALAESQCAEESAAAETGASLAQISAQVAQNDAVDDVLTSTEHALAADSSCADKDTGGGTAGTALKQDTATQAQVETAQGD